MPSIVFLVAGLSSRFNGKIKQFAEVGLEGETLIEVSMKQAKNAGFEKFVFVVGEKTEAPFKEKFGNEFQGVPIEYAKQDFDKEKRDKPWGTTDAVVSAKEFVGNKFVLCNGDDIYGKKALENARTYLEEKGNVIVGFNLIDTLPEKGKNNRGIIETNEEGFVKDIKEVFDIEKNKLEEKGLSETSLSNANLIGLEKNVLLLLEEKLIDFKKKKLESRTVECLLPIELSNLIKEKKIKLELVKSEESFFGVTNPEDEEKVRELLKQKN